MDTLQQLKDELTEEYNTTKKFIKLFPEGKNEYAPHEKSMKMMPMAKHIAEIFGWPEIILASSNLDFEKMPPQKLPEGKAQLAELLDTSYASSMAALEKVTEKDLLPAWSISMGSNKIKEWTKYGAIRHGLHQITHHRAQLGVYYRLLDISLPGSYGPSADDQSF